MIWIACENTSDEGWLRRLLRQRGLDAAVGAGGGCQVRIDRQGSVCCRGQVITCGLDRRATVTASSLLQRGGMAALQREMRTLDGRLLQPRELSLEGLPGTMTQRITGAGLLLAGRRAGMIKKPRKPWLFSLLFCVFPRKKPLQIPPGRSKIIPEYELGSFCPAKGHGLFCFPRETEKEAPL